jgi:protein-L-isoaspartate(D-aspartate) O-methyltransferase
MCDNCKHEKTRGTEAFMDVEQARTNMIESQIRTWEVLDQTILDLLAVVKREEFVPPQYRSLAFADMEIPLGHGEVMLSPRLEARMLQELALTRADKALEVGTGSGYVTALLANLAGQVISVERIEEFGHAAARKLAGHGLDNITLEIGDAAGGWARQAPYDAILLTGSVPVLPEAFREQLSIGGRLLAVIGDEPAMTATLITRVSETAFESAGLFETCIPPLRNVKQPARFVF